MNISVDKILNKVESKYKLIYIISKRAHQMDETRHFQMKESQYKSKKNLNRALEELAADLIHVK